MKLEIREQVEYLLKNYNQIKREIEMMTPLIENGSLGESKRLCEGDNLSKDRVNKANAERELMETDIIEALAFERRFGEKVQTSTIDDRTSSIALLYKDISEKEKQKALKLQEIIEGNKRELMKLETVLEVLGVKEIKVIKGIYLEEKKRRALARELFISENTLNRIRKKSIEELVRIYGEYF